MCSLDTFIALYKDKLPTDMNEECESETIKRKDKNLIKLIIIIIIVIS